jgi:hypothetical protein
MAYIFQSFAFLEVLTSTKQNQVEVNIRDHVHGAAGVVAVPDASATVAGIVSILTQEFAGQKTFNAQVTVNPVVASTPPFVIGANGANVAVPTLRSALATDSIGGLIGVTTGTATAYAVTTQTAGTIILVEGVTVSFQAHITNTGAAATLSVNAGLPSAILTASGGSIEAGDIVIGVLYKVQLRAGSWRIISSPQRLEDTRLVLNDGITAMFDTSDTMVAGNVLWNRLKRGGTVFAQNTSNVAVTGALINLVVAAPVSAIIGDRILISYFYAITKDAAVGGKITTRLTAGGSELVSGFSTVNHDFYVADTAQYNIGHTYVFECTVTGTITVTLQAASAGSDAIVGANNARVKVEVIRNS